MNFGLSKEKLAKIIEVFSRYPEIERAILYGSRAKGTHQKGSDIDIAIIAPKMDFSRYLKLLSELEDLDLLEKIDLTKYELLDPDLKAHIERVGKVIYPQNPSTCD